MRRRRHSNEEGRNHTSRVAVVAALAASTVTALLLPLSGAALPQAPPANTSPPTITGTAANGQTLSAATGSWSGTTPISFAFRWRRCDTAGANCENISGATNATYVVQSADVGKRLRARVTATNGEGAALSDSDATSVVAASGMPKFNAEPRVSGSTVVGQRLSTTNGA